jgi:ABC-2 type transport system permease protein
MNTRFHLPFRQGISILLAIVGLLLVNGVAHHIPLRIDLTADKRYTLHPASCTLVAALEAPLHLDIYLAGDLTTEFKQLQYNLLSLLEELKTVAKQPITYQLIDVGQQPVTTRKKSMQLLLRHGIEPTHLYQQVKGKRIERHIYPGIIMTYQSQQLGVLLLKSNTLLPLAAMIARSIENLEYEIVQAIAHLRHPRQHRIGLVQGHDEPRALQLQGLLKALKQIYQVDSVYLNHPSSLTGYNALLITRPLKPFSEQEKYHLDQYIMQGGKVLFFIDRLQIDMDSLSQGQSFAFPLELNLDDQLFRYGVRINYDLIKDIQAGIYPIIVGKIGNQPNMQFLPWPFFPIVNNFNDHVITKNINALYSQFISSIDPIHVKGILHTPLVYSSPHSLKSPTPIYVDVSLLRHPPDPAHYNQGPIPVIYLLEGEFPSLYKNRLPPTGTASTTPKEKSVPTKLLVASSGRWVINAISPREEKPLPWGYDPFLQKYFANQDFVLNALDYMLAEGGIINAKQKTIKLRPLDKVKLDQEKVYWQLFSMLIPLFTLLLIGIIWHIARKKQLATS